MNTSAKQIVIAAALIIVASAVASAQDFKKSYELPADAKISVSNVSGSISIAGYDGSAVVVTAYREGRDAARVTIEDRSTAGEVDVQVKYPERCECDASVRFEVQVPRSTAYRLTSNTVSGNMEISDVTGRFAVNSVSGNVRVGQVTGSVSGNTVSGTVEVAVAELEGAENMEFNSVSGDVVLRLPSSIDARVDFSTLSGEIESEFPIQKHEKKRGPGQSASGQLGSGTRTLHANSVSGDIRLLRN
jgi:DUF4097 and DUF4098 domain-containing protein YvlB